MLMFLCQFHLEYSKRFTLRRLNVLRSSCILSLQYTHVRDITHTITMGKTQQRTFVHITRFAWHCLDSIPNKTTKIGIKVFQKCCCMWKKNQGSIYETKLNLQKDMKATKLHRMCVYLSILFVKYYTFYVSYKTHSM